MIMEGHFYNLKKWSFSKKWHVNNKVVVKDNFSVYGWVSNVDLERHSANKTFCGLYVNDYDLKYEIIILYINMML